MYATRQCALSKIKLQKSPNDSSTGLLKYCQPIPFQYCSTNKIENKSHVHLIWVLFHFVWECFSSEIQCLKMFFFFILFTQFQLINCFSVECSLFSCVFLCCCPALSGLSNCYFPSIVCHKSSFVIVLVLPLLLMCNVCTYWCTRAPRE